jgi:hypothetical protein
MIVQALIESINGLCILVHGESLTEENQKALESSSEEELRDLEAQLKYELMPLGDYPY